MSNVRAVFVAAARPANDGKEDTLSRMPTFITVDELAKLLRLNRNTTYEAVQRGEIPGVTRIGRRIRICRDTVVRWLRGRGRDALT